MHINPSFRKIKPSYLLATGIILYCLLFIVLTFWKYNHFFYDNLDLAIFNNVFWNTVHGNWFAASIHAPSYLIDHFSPLILLLAPVYWLWQSPQLLLVIETLFYGLCAWPLYLVANQILGSRKQLPALFIALLWLANPLVHNGNFYEVHFISISLFFLFWAMYAYLRDKQVAFIIFALLAMSVREDIALILLMFSILALIDKKKLFWKIVPAALALLYMTIAFMIIHAVSPQGVYKFALFYNWLGGSTALGILFAFITHPVALLHHFATFTNLEFILGISFPFFFAIFIRSKYWWLALPPLAQILLAADGGSALILNTHYGSFLLFGLFMVFIIFMRDHVHEPLPTLIPPTLHSPRLRYLIIVSATVYSALTYGSILPVVLNLGATTSTAAKQSIVNRIPPNASVAATYSLLTPLSSRQNTYALHYALIGTTQYALAPYALPADTAYLAIDWNEIVKAQMHFADHHTWRSYYPTMPKNLREILSQYQLISADGPITLWQHSPNRESTDFLATVLPSLDHDATSVSLTNIQLKGTTLVASIMIPTTVNRNKNYYIGIDSGALHYALPLGFGLYQTTDLAGAQIDQNLLLAPTRNPTTITLFEWQHSFLALGPLKNIIAEGDLKAIATYHLADFVNR